ncbi:hypothetical protein [Dongia sedimenti]|uniref:Secreted protein n=1 Tax=Dongia sedimenti TaxID=3064282 RepID=A0ABU0YHI3_9PROT|nr:hypothetical protein [Rhodospirillaceae bacterium R-7]
MENSILRALTISALILAALLRPATAQNQSGPFSDAFLSDPAMQMQFTALWNSAFDLCKAEGEGRVEDCLIKRSTEAAQHGRLMGAYCAPVSSDIARHDCVVMGSVAADLVVKFGLDSVDNFIESHGSDGFDAIDAAGTMLWSYLDHKCSTSAKPDDCQRDEVTTRLQPPFSKGCKTLDGVHRQVDCLLARWIAAQVAEIAARL